MKKTYLHLFLYAISVLLFFGCINTSEAQTNPVAQTLPYSQNFSALASTSTSYPAGWQGWNLSSTGPGTTFRTIAPPAASDLALQASATAASTTVGIQNYNGKMGFLPGTTADPTLCLAITTTGYFNVSVAFDVMTIRNPYDASTNTRIDQVDLQYRVGTSGTFASVSGITNGIYQNNTTNQITAITTPQNSVSKTFTLPAACNNQTTVQLRWALRDFSGVNNRPGFAIDNITICPTQSTPTISIAGPAAFCNGGSATYVATITNGGTAPIYQWKKNGVTTGGNTSALSLSGLAIGDQIQCVLTSNATCVSSNSISSNTIVIGSVISSPTISSAVISNVSCSGIRNGAIDITITGGTPPYTVAWDTVNTTNGPLFGVTVGAKTSANPLYLQGNANCFYIDGTELKELNLVRGITYSFTVLTPSHPFQISTDLTGGNATFLVSNGQTGAPTQNGTVTFRPNNSHPALLYYPCQFHQYMGWHVNIQSGVLSEDISGLRAGIYSVSVVDANGCTTSAQYTVTELANPITLSTTTTPATCHAHDGSVNLNIAGGAAPYTACWDTTNTDNAGSFGVMVAQKTANNPYFSLGNPQCFYIDGKEAPQISLVRGIDYSFNIFSPAHTWHVSTDSIGGSSANIVISGQTNAPNDNGTVGFTPNITHADLLRYVCGNHQYMGGDILISNGYCVSNLSNLKAGTYRVIVKDVNGCTKTTSAVVGTFSPKIAVSTQNTNPTCADHDGSIDLTINSGVAPFVTIWDTINTTTGGMFAVTVGAKTPSNPNYGSGNPNCFYINGIESANLNLAKGVLYEFDVFNPGHPFHLSTDDVGGSSLGIITNGQTGAPNDNGTVTFTPDETHPKNFYYECANHQYMGSTVTLVDGWAIEDPTKLSAGSYTVHVTDALGCSATSIITLTPPNCGLTLNLKCFIQGIYSGTGMMNPVLYTNGLSSDSTAADSLIVELHDSIAPNVLAYSVTALLHTNGTATMDFPSAAIGNNYYIVVKHRNSIETWSKNTILLGSGINMFDFTTP